MAMTVREHPHHQWRTLLESVSFNRLHHAWLIAGESGSGRRSFAEHFAARILYPGLATSDAVKHLQAGGCEDYFVLEGGNPSSSVSEVRSGAKVAIGMDRVRDACSFLGFEAGASQRRVVLIDSLDELSRLAPHVLLKTVEEPHPGGILLMICQQPRRLLSALFSRCQTVTVPKPQYSDLVDNVERAGLKGVSTESMEIVWWLSNGAIGEAFTLISLPSLIEDVDDIVSMMRDSQTTTDTSITKKINDMVARWRGIDRERERILVPSCSDLIFRCLFRLLAASTMATYCGDNVKHPQRVKAWLKIVKQVIDVHPKSSHPDVVEGFYRLLRRTEKNGPALPIEATLLDAINALTDRQRLILPAFLADPS